MSQAKYIYAHDELFPNEGKMWPKEGELPSIIQVEKLTLECINVKHVGSNNFMNAETWNFQVVGHGDTWYHTHYEWSLIENTPENLKLHREFQEIHRERERLLAWAEAVHGSIRTIRSENVASNG